MQSENGSGAAGRAGGTATPHPILIDAPHPQPIRPQEPARVPLRELVSALSDRLVEPAPVTDPAAGGGTGAIEAPMVSGVSQDSRAVCAGDLYLARAGQQAHGAQFAAAAVAAGAVAALTDPAGAGRCRAAGLPTLVVADPGTIGVEVAHTIYRQPATSMTMLGVTGTNGKTTTVFLLDAGLQALGHTTGLVGTIMVRIGDQTYPSTRSTPEATELTGVFATMRENGCDTCSMEVSSHALQLDRVAGIRFDVACFLNLSQEHLDQHGDMETYFGVKARLFTPAYARRAVIDVDTSWGRRLARRADAAGLEVTTLSGTGRSRADAVVRAVRSTRDGGYTGTLELPDGQSTELRVRMPGAFNLANAAAAATIIWAIGGDVPTAAAGMAGVAVPGRMEPVGPVGTGPAVFVDFAHTPEAVTQSLAAVQERVRGRVIAVGGCGGDRDPGKRAPMGAAMVVGADVVIITDDNPRTEDPVAIRAAILAGISAAGAQVEVMDIGDRAAAIVAALDAAQPQDVVVVLGKGHEIGQDIAGVVHPFDDRTQVRAWQAAHGEPGDAS